MAHEGREAEPLHHQRHEDHAEGDEDDQVARGKRRAAADGEWQGERDDQRVRATQSCPRDEERLF
jgi:hypothetical protein